MSLMLRLAAPLAILLAGCAIAAEGPAQDTPAKDRTQSSRPRIRFGGIMIGAGYSHFSGPGYGRPYYGYGPWGFYDSFLYGMYFHPGYFHGFGYGPAMGEIKLKSDDKAAWVYLDGALAGKADKLKNMWLEPGAYNLEVRSGAKRFGQKVYVLSGKTLRLTADLTREELQP
jgi:hypothetical protein